MNKLQQEDVEKRVKDCFSEDIVDVISEYTGVMNNLKVKCRKCGYIIEDEARKFLDKKWNRRCPRCKNEEDEYFNWKVYMHIFPNDKVYIGITSQTLKSRWANGEGYKTQKRLYEAIKEFGWNNIEHKMVYDKLTKDEAENKEMELIKEYYADNKEFGYNIQSGGINNSVEKPVLQYNLDGDFLNEYTSVRKAAKIVGCQETSIALVCRMSGKQKKTGNYMWRYKTSENFPQKIEPYTSKRGSIDIGENTKKKIAQLDVNGMEIKVWDSITDASKFFNRHISSLSKALRKNQKCAGYYWKYCKGENNDDSEKKTCRN